MSLIRRIWQIVSALWQAPPRRNRGSSNIGEAFTPSEATKEAMRRRQKSYLRVRADDDGDDVRSVTGCGECPCDFE